MLSACQNSSKVARQTVTEPIRIAFGSCAHQDKDQPMLEVAARLKPDVFVFLGDNIYGDTEDMDVLKSKYTKLGNKKEFQQLWDSTRVLAVWDDHDYGENDAGRHYPYKEPSKEIFLDFWKVPANSERRQHKGIYGVEELEKNGKVIQFILLDTRTFRDDLIWRTEADKNFKNDYKPNTSPDSTFLGEAQWAWLESVLTQPADVRIIASSNQFSHSYNGWESWTNVPHEQQKMIDLIKKTKANGVVFISGDVHWGEISKMKIEGGYPIYDVTSSGITEDWDKIEPNDHRIGEAIPQNNIGLIELQEKDGELELHLNIIDRSEKPVVDHKVALSEISF